MRTLFRVFLLYFLLLLSLSISAATLTVTKLADTNDGTCDSDCSLREAIAAGANSDTITFNAGLSGGTITLGGTELTLNTDLTIDGDLDDDGSPDMTVSGNNTSGVFHIPSAVIDATIDGLTIQDGTGTTDVDGDISGGGILIYQGILTIQNSVVSNNTATYGGGILNYDGTLIMQNTSLSTNSSTISGGGIYDLYGSITIENSSLSDNSSGYGGGIINDHGTTTIQNTTFSGNAVSASGGGIYDYYGTTTIQNTTLSGNSASAYGGGIENYGTVILENSIISSNSASYGGGIDNYGTVTLENSTFSDNTATTSGGGIYNDQGATTAQNTTFSSNSSSNDGGGVYNYYGTATVQNTTLSSNSSSNNGGGIYNYYGTATVQNTTLFSNSSNYGGGIYNYYGTATVENSTFSGNSGDYGGGIYDNHGTATVENSTFSGNSASSNKGGGMRAYRSTSFTLKNTVIANSPTGSDCTYNNNVPIFSEQNVLEDNSCRCNFSSNCSSGDPILGTLADNGGSTETHHPLLGSSLIDAGSNCLTEDQRGVSRPQNASCDIGAIEFAACNADITLSYGWTQLALPCQPTAPATVSSILGDDLGDGNYLSTWAVWKDVWNGRYYEQMSLTDTLEQGSSYWVLTLNETTVDIEGSAPTLSTAAPCPDSTYGCFVIDIDPTYTTHMLGHPLPYALNWADVRYSDGTTAKTPSEADDNDVLWAENLFYRYNGNNYDSHDDVISPTTLDPHNGIWVKTLANAPVTLQLLIPATGSNSMEMATASTSEIATMRQMAFVKDREKQTKKTITEWKVDLTVEVDGMTAANNLLGWHPNSDYGYDAYDLPEKAPFSVPYLTLVFPHSDWNERAGDYTTDFHPPIIQGTDFWSFVIRSNTAKQGVVLRWTGEDEILADAALVDLATGESIPGSVGYYQFTMQATTHTFEWQYATKLKKK